MENTQNMIDIDPDFEPQARPRSCTWPLRRPDFLDNKPNQQAGAAAAAGAAGPAAVSELPHSALSPASVLEESPDSKLGLIPLEGGENRELSTPSSQRRNGSRRNAWGNLSYADLITKAIQSAPEQRLTLSQIYDWMVKNVPYFKDKGDSNSSAGWKNSIRHNLSLHSRFVRVQNEGTGKSSWWMINPDAKPGKSSRRRASSMDTTNPKFERKRGRAKKKVLEERAKWGNTSPTSTLDGEEGASPLPFNLTTDFRSRASSNASSCGRLSPIMTTHPELDLHDSEVPPMSPIPFGDMAPSQAYDSPDPYHNTDQLAKMAKAMTLDSSLSVEPAIRHSQHSMANNNGGYLFSPQSYSGSDMSPVHSNTQSPYYSQQVTPAVSPLGQCSPMQELPPGQYGMRQSFTSMMQESSMPANEPIISQDPMFSPQQQQSSLLRQQSPRPLPSCREQSIHSSPQRLVHAQTPSNLAMLLNNGHNLGGDGMHQHSGSHHHTQQIPYPSRGHPHHIQHPVPHHAHHPGHPHIPGLPGHHDRFPSDLEQVQLDPLKGWNDLDVETILRNEQDLTEGPDSSFDNIGTIGTTASTIAPPSWVH